MPAAAPNAPASLGELFLAFARMALHGFGGVLPWAQRVLVEEKQWLTLDDFVEMLAFGQLLPGPNVVNVSIMVGDRYFGWRGAAAAMLGMLVFPAMLVVSLAAVYARFASEHLVQRAMAGMSAVAAGLIIGMGVKLALGRAARWRWLGFAVLAFVAVGVLRLPLPWVLATLIPVAVAAAWWREGAAPPKAAAEPGGQP